MKNKTNIKQLLLYIKDSFEFNDSGWRDKAIDFIATGIELIGCNPSFEPKSVALEVEDNRVVLPCCVESIIEILDGDNPNYKIDILNTTTLTTEEQTLNTSSTKYAEIHGSFIQFNFETGNIILKYYALPLDEDGLPLVVRSAEVYEALSWWVAYKLILSGNKHHTITSWKEALQMWNNLKPKAQNNLKELTPQEMAIMAGVWTDPMVRNSLYNYI